MASLEQHISVLSQAMNLRTQRHQVLASNIANADTPNYKARDFGFEAAMQNVIAGRNDAGGVDMARTSARHIEGSGAAGPAALQYRTETQSAVDGNTVDMDLERSAFSENALQYQAGLSFITHQLKMLMSAVQG